MRKKIGQEMPPYRILGACNPHMASKAIARRAADRRAAAVQRRGAPGRAAARFTSRRWTRSAVLQLVDNPAVPALAAEVRQKLEQALAGL